MNIADITSGAHERRVLLSAFGIHTGGGRVLLEALLPQLRAQLKLAALDARLNSAAIDTTSPTLHVQRSFAARLHAIDMLARESVASDVLFCFNSLPPLRRTAGKVILYVHAPHFAGLHRDIPYSRITALRIALELLWFRRGLQHVDEIWVQTESMAAALRPRVPRVPVHIVPFVDDTLADGLARVRAQPSAARPMVASSYFFPAEAVGHKNHERLLRAWDLLAQQLGEDCPRLHLTLEPGAFAALLARGVLAPESVTTVRNLGPLPRAEVLAEMQRSTGLIFPSLAETLGLPLLEATALSVPILAPELDYVRDIVQPSETFDPQSVLSIARAVRRHMGYVAPTTDFLDAAQLVKRILS